MDIKSNDGFNFSTMKLQLMNGKKTFECQSNRFLPYVKIFAFPKPNSAELQVSVTMYYLSDEGRFRKTANAIEVAKNTVSIIIR